MAMMWNEQSDEVLLQCVQNSEERTEVLQATDVLLTRHKDLVRHCARFFFLTGADQEDVVQEGMIGLYNAIMDYRADKFISFSSFAELCIRRQIISAVRSSNRQKHEFLNDSLSLDEIVVYDEEGEGITLMDTLLNPDGKSPETLLSEKEELLGLKRRIIAKLSTLEKNVLRLYLQDNNYIQIAEYLDRSPKSVDNALQRIRSKIRKELAEWNTIKNLQ